MFNVGNYRFGFNGKEKDLETTSTTTYDYGFRIYNPALGKFLSVDPLTTSYPMLTPYQFASDRPIDGIDLDGLEYLDADEARVEFTGGDLKLKVENFIWINRNAWNNANSDPKNWDKSGKEIGLSKTIGSISTTAPKIADPVFKDLPVLPSSAKGNTESGIKMEGYNRGGKREIARGKTVNAPLTGTAKTVGKVGAVLDFAVFSYEQYAIWSYVWDQSKITKHSALAQQALNDVVKVMNEHPEVIPEQYRNATDLGNIANVVLQGVNNTKNKAIYDIGMKVYDIVNPPNPDAQTPQKELNPKDNTRVESTPKFKD